MSLFVRRLHRCARLSMAPLVASLSLAAFAADAPPTKGKTMQDVLAASQSSDWRAIDPNDTLYLELATGRVVIELAPAFAPNHVANIRALAREGFFDGLSINRVQDNFVTQWGDPNAGEANARPIKNAKEKLPGEFERASKDLAFTRLPDGDVYAPEVGFSNSMPAARDPKRGQAWLAHCYGMLGVGRGDTPESGNGSELYVVIGNAPRHLDRNVAVVGRVLSGMELLSTLPRGMGPLGFYEKPSQYVPIRSMRLAADLPAAERPSLEVLRTDTPTFSAWVESRRNRRESWFVRPTGYVELCNVPIPVRPAAGHATK